MRRSLRFAGLAGAALLALTLLGGCAIATPMRAGPALPRAQSPVVVAVTHAVLDPARRAAFDDQVRSLAETLPEQPGLLGFSLRRDLIGNELWTMTIWQDDVARMLYVESPAHRAAIAAGAPALLRARFVRFERPAGAETVTWDEALRRLDAEGRGYAPPKR